MKLFYLLMLLGLLSLNSCSSVLSLFDGVSPVQMAGDEHKSQASPEGFVVSVFEVRDIVPATKSAWDIYANGKNYYPGKL